MGTSSPANILFTQWRLPHILVETRLVPIPLPVSIPISVADNSHEYPTLRVFWPSLPGCNALSEFLSSSIVPSVEQTIKLNTTILVSVKYLLIVLLFVWINLLMFPC